jgi:hypothetical protein
MMTSVGPVPVVSVSKKTGLSANTCLARWITFGFATGYVMQRSFEYSFDWV